MQMNIGQENAVKRILSLVKLQSVTVLQGAAGTGKTFVISKIKEAVEDKDGRGSVKVATFTGTATKVLNRRIEDASTLHSLLYKATINKNTGVVTFHKKKRDSFRGISLIIVDEFSMVSNWLMQDLLSLGIPLLLVGDPYQLPPIGETNDYFQQQDVMLTEVVRQALDSPILWAATKVRNKERLELGTHDNLFIGTKADLREEWLVEKNKILVGRNKTKDSFNHMITGVVKPDVMNFKPYKIMFLKNDWDMGITNGTIGTLSQIKYFGSDLRISGVTEDGNHFRNYNCNWGKYIYQKNKPFIKNGIDFAYAMSVHKAQGSTFFDSGIIYDESFCFPSWESNWTYTALTRFDGKSRVALLL